MIFLIKGRSNVGKSGFSQRLAEHLCVVPPVWPISEEELRDYGAGLDGWPAGASDFLVGTRHVDIDKVGAIVLFRHRLELPLPPAKGAPFQDYEIWRDETTRLTLEPPLYYELLDLAFKMIESMDHPIVDGTAVGTSRRDSRLAKTIRFKYSQQSFLSILLKRTPYESATLPKTGEIIRVAEVNGRDYTYDQLLSKIHRGPNGDVVVDEELRPGGG